MYTQAPTSQVVQTAWTIIALLHANYPDQAPIKRAVQLIIDRQQPNGSWKQEQIEGIFNQYVALLTQQLYATTLTQAPSLTRTTSSALRSGPSARPPANSTGRP